MRVLVQIPTKNEAEDIADVISSIPKKIDGVSELHVLVIDDQSTDDTVQLAEKAGVDFIILKSSSPGLAQSFNLGLGFFLSKGYDILVNTDGDNQYFQEKIPELIQPILERKADLVVGDRVIDSIKHFSWGKKVFQRLGSRVISFVSGAKIPDAASGFRAYSRELASKLNVTTRFSYAMETLIQAGNSHSRIVSVPCGAREVSRPSRLFSSHFEHVFKSGQAILRGLVTYRPLATFLALSSILGIAGLIPFIRFLVLTFSGSPGDHIQSLILGVILLSGAFTSLTLAVLSDLIRSQRVVSEQRLSLERLSMDETWIPAILDSCSAELIKDGRKSK